MGVRRLLLLLCGSRSRSRSRRRCSRRVVRLLSSRACRRQVRPLPYAVVNCPAAAAAACAAAAAAVGRCSLLLLRVRLRMYTTCVRCHWHCIGLVKLARSSCHPLRSASRGLSPPPFLPSSQRRPPLSPCGSARSALAPQRRATRRARSRAQSPQAPWHCPGAPTCRAPGWHGRQPCQGARRWLDILDQAFGGGSG
jgi:hypothetical protein